MSEPTKITCPRCRLRFSVPPLGWLDHHSWEGLCVYCGEEIEATIDETIVICIHSKTAGDLYE